MLGASLALWIVACAPETDLSLDATGLGSDEESAFAADFPDDDGGGREFDFQPTPFGGLPERPVVPDQTDSGQPVADSMAQFTSVQGMHGWFYGYIEPDNANTFTEAEVYVSGGADPGWYALPDARTWTFMDATTMHPNGEITTQGREAVEQWAARRWVSTYEGNVRISGDLAKFYVDGTSSGIAGYIFVDGVMVWAWYLEGWDESGISFDKSVALSLGSTVDFVLDPWESDDRSDRSMFTAQIYPED